MENNNVFAERLRKALEYREKRPIDLTNDIGLNKSLISQYLNGKFEAKNDKIAIISKYLNINPLYLMGWTDEFGFYSNNLIEVLDEESFNSYATNSPEHLRHQKEKNTYGDHQANLDYFADKPELLELYKQINASESLQLLFDSAKDLSPEDLESVLIHIQGIRKARGLD